MGKGPVNQARQVQQGGSDVDIAYNQGNALQRAGRHLEAVSYYDQALAVRPDWVEALTNRGVALLGLKRPEDAIASFDRVLAIRPAYALALSNRGNALCSLARHQQALMSYDRALLVAPDNPETLYNRGTALQALARHAEALESYDRALTLRLDFAQALIGRASALLALRQPAEALQSCIRALAINPNYAEALIVFGNVLGRLNRPEEALVAYDRALVVRPDYVGAFYNRGNVLQTLARYEEALADYERALALSPDYTDALSNRGNALLTLRRNAEAADDFERVLTIDPDYPYAQGKLLHARMRRCDWSSFEQLKAEIAANVEVGRRCTMPFEYLVISDSPGSQHQCARSWIADNCPAMASPMSQASQRNRGDRIRLAYLSADFHEHATAYLLAGLFEQHDRTKFETIAISYGPDNQSEMRLRLKGAFDRFIDIRNMSDSETAALLHEMAVDIAVDLKGLTGDSRPAILAARPAPIQVNYLGYPGTMGADYIDYIIADPLVIPEGDRPHYSEKVVYLPDTYAANDSKRRIADRAPTREEVGLPETGFVFCSFNNSHKITPDIFDIWMRLLREVDGSVLWLLAADESAVRNLRREAEARDVQSERLVFAPRAKLEDHLARHRVADLFLDTLPYNAHTTASDALWAGLPLVTCLGSAFAGRVAGSLLNALDFRELITHSLEEYEALALRLARDQNLLAATKTKLMRNRETHPLFDTNRFRKHIEAAYVVMLQRYQSGQPPVGFSVEPIRE